MRKFSCVVGLLFSLVGYSSFGSEAPEASVVKHPLVLFGGLGGGYDWVSGGDYGSSPTGPHLFFNATLAYRLASRWQLDAGMGWFYSSLNGRTTQQLPIQIRTRAGMFDLAPLYSLSHRWQIGPSATLLFGTDTEFGSQVGNSTTTFMLGGRVVYTVLNDQFPLRVWSQLATDTNISGRRLISTSLGVQIGIPLLSNANEVPSEKQGSVEGSVLETRPGRVQIILDPNKVFFKTSSAELKANIREILKEVGTYLEKEPNRKTTVVISGHADQRGKYGYNLRLSKKRAETVRMALMSEETDASRFKVSAFSYRKPVDSQNNEIAWAHNRRVELSFENVREPEKLLHMLRPIAFESPQIEGKKK